MITVFVIFITTLDIITHNVKAVYSNTYQKQEEVMELLADQNTPLGKSSRHLYQQTGHVLLSPQQRLLCMVWFGFQHQSSKREDHVTPQHLLTENMKQINAPLRK